MVLKLEFRIGVFPSDAVKKSKLALGSLLYLAKWIDDQFVFAYGLADESKNVHA